MTTLEERFLERARLAEELGFNQGLFLDMAKLAQLVERLNTNECDD